MERSVNAFAAVVIEASQRNIRPTEFELEIFVAADDAHSWGEDDLAPTYIDNRAISKVTSSGVTLGD